MSGAFRSADATAPAHGIKVVSPNDVTDIPCTRALWVGVAGNITVNTPDGDVAVLIANVPVGVLPIQVTRIYNTGTGASSILALY